MDQVPQDRQIPSEPSPAADADRGDQPRAPGTSSTPPAAAHPGILVGTPRRADLWVPDPQFPTTKAPTDERWSGPGPLAPPAGELNPGCPAGESSVGLLRWARCPDDGRLHLLHDPGPQGYPVSSPVPDGPPVISANAAARALQEYFLANADRGDNAANDELVAEMVHRIRALRASREGGC